MREKLLGPKGPLGVFVEFPILARLALICTFAETAWATLLIVMEFYFKEELFPPSEFSQQYVASRVATVFLAFVGCETLFKYPMGALADRFGARRFVFLALSICSVTPLLMMLLSRQGQWTLFMPLRALDGFAAAALWPAMSALMSRSVPREAKAAAMSVFNGAYCLGLAIGPMTGLALGHLLGSNRYVFPGCALVMMLGLLIARAALKPDAVGVSDAPQKVPGTARDAALPPSGSRPSILAGRPMLKKMMVLYGLSQVAVGILAPTLPLYIDSQFGIKQADLAKLIAIPALMIVLIAIPLGRLPDTLGRSRSVWISYVLATVGMMMVAGTSLMPTTQGLLSLPLTIFGVGVLLLAGSYILGTPAWLGLTSLQVDDSRQAEALSLMQTAQGVGVVLAFALVASAGYLLTQWHNVNDAIYTKLPRLPRFSHRLTLDIVPLSMWFWIATGVFALCLIGTLLFVREPKHDAHAEELAQGGRQPLEISGF